MKIKTWLFLIFIYMLLVKEAFTQITFQKTFNGANGSNGNSVQQTSDEGYIIAGSATQALGLTNEDVYLIKTDKTGDVQWTNFYGGPAGDVAYSVQETNDGGFIVAGNTNSYGAGPWDVYLIKVDVNGNTEWTRTIGGSEDDRCYSVSQTNDGGFILVGTTSSFEAKYYDIYLIKTDNNGNEIWAKIFGGNGGEYAYSAEETNDGGFIITGNTQSFGPDGYTDTYLIKTDNMGNIVWSKIYGGPSNEGGNAVKQTLDGGYIIAGITEGFLSYPKSDFYIIKTDEEGVTLWSKTYGGESYDNATSIDLTIDGGYIIAGNTNRKIDGIYHCYLIKTDGNGNIVWTNTFGTIGYDNGNYFVQQTMDGGYIITGTTYSNTYPSKVVFLVKTDALGNTCYNSEAITTVINVPETEETLTNTTDSNVVSIQSIPNDLYKKGTDNATPICFNEIDIDNKLFVYPNPCTDEIIVAGTGINGVLMVYNIAGQIKMRLETVSTQTILNIQNLATGIYLLNYKDENKKMSIKLIKL